MNSVRSLMCKESGSKHRQLLRQILHDIEPFHPTDAFDMIVGTSTGGLIALGLLAGNEKNGKRVTMSVRECLDMYLGHTAHIFGASAWAWYSPLRWWFHYSKSLPYSQGNLEQTLKEIFGDACLKDVDSSCVGGCVAKVVGVKEEKLKFFNNVSIFEKDIPLYKVLMATCDAPIYFDGPVKINGQQFVDGGVGGNCPLAQAIPTALQLWGSDCNLMVVSLAPPMGTVDKVPSGTLNQIKYWLGYFPNQVTSGGMIYRALKADFNLGRTSQFYRILPEGDIVDSFGMDEVNVQAMIKATEEYAFSQKGMSEMLPIVFSIVSELVAREKKKKEKYGKRHFPSVNKKREYNGFLLFAECQQQIYDWILKNSWELVRIILRSKSVTEKSERVEYLLMALEKTYESLDIDLIRRDFVTESKILKTLGAIFSLNGKQGEARRLFHRLILTLDAVNQASQTAPQYKIPTHYTDVDPAVITATATDTMSIMDRVEAIILYGITREKNGFFSGERLRGDGFLDRGALFFYEEALTCLSPRGKRAKRKSRAEQLINFCHFKIGRCFMELGHLETAMNHFNTAIKSFNIQSATNSNALPTYTMGDIAVDETLEAARVWHFIGLTYMKMEDLVKATEALETALELFATQSNCRDSFADLPLDKLAQADCLGLLFIARGEPERAVKHYNGALRMIKDVMGTKPHLSKSEIMSHMALASLMANYFNDGYRFYRSILETMKQIDDNFVHPLIAKSAANMAVVDIHRFEYFEALDLLQMAHDQFDQIHAGLEDDRSTLELQQIDNNMACLLCLMKDFADAGKIMDNAVGNCDTFSCPFVRMTEDIHNNDRVIKYKTSKDETSKMADFHFFILV